MRKLNKLIIPLMLSGALLSGCSQSLTVNEDMTAESTKESTVETTEAAETAENATGSTENSNESDYSLSDEGKEDLEWVFANCYYFEIGEDKVQKLSELPLSVLDGVIHTTLIEPSQDVSELVEDGGYTIDKSIFNKYLKEGFGVDLDSLDFTDSILQDRGDIIFTYGGDYGAARPMAVINRAVQDKDTGIITMTGDAFLVCDDHTVNAYYFEATMQPCDSSYFGGNTLLTFSYTKNTGDYAHIDTSRFGEGFWKIQ